MTAGERAYAKKIPSEQGELWRTKRPLLAWLDIELTERCNNDCIHCCVNRPSGDRRAKARELATDEIHKVLQEAADLGCLAVRFTGGEPLLRDDFEEIYVAARRLGLRVMVFTNASLLTPRLIGLLRKIPPLERMEISVYGLTRESCRAVTRNPGCYDAARRAIGLLVEHKIPFILKGTLLPPTMAEKAQFETWAATVTGKDLKAAFVMTLDLTSRRDPAKNDLIRGLRMSARQFIEFSTAGNGGRLEDWKRFVVKFAGLPGKRLFTCFPGRSRGSVDAYGMFQYCLSLRHPETIHELKKGSLKKAILEFLPRLAEMTATDPRYLERCSRCFLKAFCQQCPAKSWTEYGTLDTPVDYFCEITHAQATSIGILGEGEKAWDVDDWPARVKWLAESLDPETSPRGEFPRECAGE